MLTPKVVRHTAWDATRRLARQYNRLRDAKKVLWGLGEDAQRGNVAWDGANDVADGVVTVYSFASCRVYHSWIFGEVVRAAVDRLSVVPVRDIVTLLWSISFFQDSPQMRAGTAALLPPLSTGELNVADLLMLIKSVERSPTSLTPETIHDLTLNALHASPITRQAAISLIDSLTKISAKTGYHQQTISIVTKLCQIVLKEPSPDTPDRLGAIMMVGSVSRMYQNEVEFSETFRKIMNLGIRDVFLCEGSLRPFEVVSVLAALYALRGELALEKIIGGVESIVKNVLKRCKQDEIPYPTAVSMLFFTVKLGVDVGELHEAVLNRFMTAKQVTPDVFSRLIWSVTRIERFAEDTDGKRILLEHIKTSKPHLTMNGRELTDTIIGLGGYFNCYDKTVSEEVSVRTLTVADQLSANNCAQILGYLSNCSNGAPLGGVSEEAWKAVLNKVKMFPTFLSGGSLKLVFFAMVKSRAEERELLKELASIAADRNRGFPIRLRNMVYILNCLSTLSHRSTPLLDATLIGFTSRHRDHLPPSTCTRLLKTLTIYPLTQSTPITEICTDMTYQLLSATGTQPLLTAEQVSSTIDSLTKLSVVGSPAYAELERALHSKGLASIAGRVDGLVD